MNSKMTRIRTVLRYLMLGPMIAFGLLSIIATGGGGGGGGGGPGGFPFEGNTDPAIITTTNAATLVANVMGSTATTGAITASSVTASAPSQRTDQARLARRLSRHLRDILTQTLVARSGELRTTAAIVVDETELCESGSIRITGTINDNGTGTLDVAFNACRFGDETLNGQVTLRVDAFDLNFFIITDATFSFSSLTLTSPGVNESVSGSLRLQVTIGTNTERLTVNMVTRDNTTGHMTKAENLVIVDVYDNVLGPSSFSETLAGRVFDSVHGFVDITTLVPLFFSSLVQSFPESGQLVLTANSSIRVTVLSPTLLRLELDLDGDDVYEITAIMQWVQLAEDVNADVDDSDADGMHNSWEDVHGLNPSDPSDATEDPDNDGFTNLEEYQSGTDPQDGSSAPVSADLSITKTDSADPVTAGANFNYLLTVNNAGPDAASDVQVQDSLPVGVTFVSASGSGWSCNNLSGTVTCTRGSLAIGVAPTITIRVMAPATTGSLSNTASVSSDTIDPDGSNNSATEATEVVPPSADLSITKTASPTGVLVGASLTYTLRVRNNGPEPAIDVVVTDALPTDMTFDSATPSQGSCNGTVTVTCDLGTLGNFSVATIDIVVTPTTEGTAENTASVTGGVLDPDTTNNSATVTTAVGISASVIQAQIDAAVDGDTVLVAAGIYIGTIDFVGKAITVTSDQGPEVTIIDGGGILASVVSMVSGEGPTSVLDGFTIQNGGGGGIDVASSSPTIINNIIQNNLRPGSGVGISLQFASATVEGNLIRNNDRGPGSGGGGGGINVQGDSNAQIIDNIIVDNLWGGGIQLFAAGTPVLRGNVISGNSGGGLSVLNRMEGVIVQNLIVENIGAGVSGLGARALYLNNTIAGNLTFPGISTSGIPPGTELVNNIIVGADGNPAINCDTFGSDIDPSLFRFNNVFSSGASYAGVCTDQTGVNGNISADPLFVDPSNGDYRLDAASPAIDAGDNTVSALPATDIAGNDRVVDGDGDSAAVVDMGAHEFIP